MYRPIVARYTRHLDQELATLAPPEPSEWEYPDEYEYPEMSAAGSWPDPRLPTNQPPVSP